MNLLLPILLGVALFGKGSSLPPENGYNEPVVATVIRAYYEQFEQFFTNQSFYVHNLQYVPDISFEERKALSSIADQLRFFGGRVERFCNVSRDSSWVDEKASKSFLIDVKRYLSTMKSSIPGNFIEAADSSKQAVVRILIEYTGDSFQLQSKLEGQWDRHAPSLSHVLMNISNAVPFEELVTNKESLISSKSPRKKLIENTAAIWEHINSLMDLITSSSLSVVDSPEMLVRACSGTTWKPNNESPIDYNRAQRPVSVTPSSIATCPADAVDGSVRSWCWSNCENCDLTLCKSTLNQLVRIGNTLLIEDLKPVYQTFLQSLSGNKNSVCVSLFHHILLNRAPLLAEALSRIGQQKKSVSFRVQSSTPYNVVYSYN